MKVFNKIIIASLIGIVGAGGYSNISTVQAKNIESTKNYENRIDNINIQERSARSVSIAEGGGGGRAIYRTTTRVGAPWLLPKSVYYQEWINGRLYKGWLQYSGSKPLGQAPVVPNHAAIATYAGYIY